MLEAGMDEQIAKPLRGEEVAEVLARWLPAAKERRSAVIPPAAPGAPESERRDPADRRRARLRAALGPRRRPVRRADRAPVPRGRRGAGGPGRRRARQPVTPSAPARAPRPRGHLRQRRSDRARPARAGDPRRDPATRGPRRGSAGPRLRARAASSRCSTRRGSGCRSAWRAARALSASRRYSAPSARPAAWRRRTSPADRGQREPLDHRRSPQPPVPGRIPPG